MVNERVTAKMAEMQAHMRNTMITFMVGAFGFVAALFWNDAIKSAVEAIFPNHGTIIAKFVVAIVVTVIAALVIYILEHGKT